jgi:hypothetical protein
MLRLTSQAATEILGMEQVREDAVANVTGGDTM